MRARTAWLLAAPAASPVSARSQHAPPATVMLVGDFHMSNPGRDLHNLAVDDVLAPWCEAEIARVATSLSRFRPDGIAVECRAALAATRYGVYLKGTLGPSRNEVARLGFRLSEAHRLPRVYGLDVEAHQI